MSVPALLLCLAAAAQDPADAWRTLSTGHFRVHYPAAAEPWVLAAAPRWEALHAEVVAAVGHAPERPVDVVVMDPYATANGFALPVLGSPRMGVFPTPPDASSSIGHFSDWSDELVGHEDTHLVHMSRPSRNPLGGLVTERLLGVGPLALKTPLWAVEGYAVHLEGALTGEGRPRSASRAVFLRDLAAAGALPAYKDLSGSNRWGGRAVPYLVGSAFVEWLVEREGEGSLNALWKRLSARRIRGFAEAFEGVYGERPEVLYARFCAELTQRALDLEDQRGAASGTLWEEFARSTGAPALSPDGGRIAVVVDPERGPPTLRVLSTAPDAKVAARWDERVAKVLAKDPEDVAPKKPAVFPHEVLHAWRRGDRAPEDPRWLPGGQTLLFTAWVAQPDGDLLPELFTWTPGRHRARRVTRGAGVKDADPHPDGTWAAAVEQRWGSARLVRVDLRDGTVAGLTAAEVGAALDQPRVSPDGRTLAFLRHVGAWEIALLDLSTGAVRAPPLPAGSEALCLAWEPTGEGLLVSLASGGFVEIARLPLAGGAPQPITRTFGSALSPAPTPDGAAVFYLASDHLGLALHQAPLAPAPTEPAVQAEAPVVPLPPAAVGPRAEAPFAEPPRPYGLGRAEVRPVIGAATARDAGTTQLGLRLGDILGRWELFGQAGLFGNAMPVGGGLTAAWNGWPVALRAEVFAMEERADEDFRRFGGEVALGRQIQGDATWGAAALGLWSDRPWGGDPGPARTAPFLAAEGGRRLWAGRAWFDLSAWVHGQQVLGGDPLGRARADLGLGFGAVGLTGSAGIGRAGADDLRLGGVESALLPEGWQASRVFAPVLAPGAATGSAHASWRAAFDVGGAFDLFVERHTLEDDAGATAVGLDLRAGMPSRPLVRLPGLAVTLGVACVPEDPVEGWRPHPCAEGDHWSVWTSLLWRPTRPVLASWR